MSTKKVSRVIKKDCEREWVISPVSGKWIEVNGATWKELYPKHKKQLDAAERKTTLGVMKKGICTPPVGDPPHGGGGGGRSGGGGGRSGGGSIGGGSRGGGGSGGGSVGGIRSGGGGVRSGSIGRTGGGGRIGGGGGGGSVGIRSGGRIEGGRIEGGEREGGRISGGYSPRRYHHRHNYPGGYYRHGVGIVTIPMYDPYWWGPPCWGDRWCWERYGYIYGVDFWL